ncbi:hypothetical protein Cob_v009248 [Colletotrichum orbiculare MAFF 240422]|uniref:Uncharacterized protein n=1 Tax=Colletotrichum orbiculare (strain 104-T / ATCC 96160 / CBS 514.97 / LARS 414 / MAFF 240422) TaxID=1213857 RepID=N4V2Z0_COLOR|nr:hypothetical protein Cob_v009248 [Colletotrichum orbiculare MAFF 240422]
MILNTKCVLACLLWLAATVIAKSDVGGLERIWFYLAYQLVFQNAYTTEKERANMPLLPFLKQKSIFNTGNRGAVKTDPATGKPTPDSEMLSFQQFLNRLNGVGDADERFSADAKDIKWSDNFEDLGKELWDKGFGGEMNMKVARGVQTWTEDIPQPARTYPALVNDMIVNLERMKSAGLNDGMRKTMRSMESLLSVIVADRRLDSARFFANDIERYFFPTAADGKLHIERTEQDPNDKTKTIRYPDIRATLADPANKQAIQKALGGRPPGDVNANWWKIAFMGWCDEYGSKYWEPPTNTMAARSHYPLLSAWDLCQKTLKNCLG